MRNLVLLFATAMAIWHSPAFSAALPQAPADPNKPITMTLAEWQQLEADIQARAIANYVQGLSAVAEKKFQDQVNPPPPHPAPPHSVGAPPEPSAPAPAQ